MKTRIPISTVLVTLGFALVSARAPAVSAAGVSSALENAALSRQVRAYLQPYVDLDVFSGVVLLARGDRVLVAEPFGQANRELGVANAVDQRFRIASLSKVLTKIAIGTLLDAGRMQLDAPLARYLPGYPAGARVTIEQLLAHRAGVPNLNSLPYDEEALAPNDLDRLVAVLGRQPLEFTPGTEERYSNGGYALLAAALERVTGERYGAYLQRAVLTPLGLRDTEHEEDGAVIARLAYGYTPHPSRAGAMSVAPFQEMATKTGGGSLVSSAADLHRLALALLHEPVLRPATWRALFHERDGALLFTGRCPGFNAALYRTLADDVVVVVLANDYAAGMVADLAPALAGMVRGRAPEPVSWKAEVAQPVVRLQAMAGAYEPPPGALPLPPGTPVDVVVLEGHLVLRAGGVPLDVLIAQGGDRFLARNLWAELTFAADRSAVVYRPLFRGGEVTLKRTVAQR
jgi:CubicO group peptidase (beta-lactamase class C family)